MRYRKKLELIDAVKVGDVLKNIHANPTAVPEWIRNALKPHEITLIELHKKAIIGKIAGDEDDWIVRDSYGSISICTKSLFSATYEAAE